MYRKGQDLIVTKLTVYHLQYAPFASQILGQMIVHVDDVAVDGFILRYLADTTRRVHIVAPRVVGVDGTLVIASRHPREGVLVKTALGRHTVRVRLIFRITYEELQVSLMQQQRTVGRRAGRGGCKT